MKDCLTPEAIPAIEKPLPAVPAVPVAPPPNALPTELSKPPVNDATMGTIIFWAITLIAHALNSLSISFKVPEKASPIDFVPSIIALKLSSILSLNFSFKSFASSAPSFAVTPISSYSFLIFSN